MFRLSHLHKVIIHDVPLQWMTRIDLFSSDLEQFPLMYLHVLADRSTTPAIGNYNPDNKQRIYGFVLSSVWGDVKENGLCDVEMGFACNIPQNYSAAYDASIHDELSHRIGLADKVSYDDLEHICENAPESLPLLQKIWKDKIETVYGNYIPHGRIFDEMFGIVRFSASGNAPKLGRTSEYRMLYWYIKDLGERITFDQELKEFNFLESYLIPTYDELLLENFEFFEIFRSYFLSTKRFFELEYNKEFEVNGHSFKYAAGSALPADAETFEKRYPDFLGMDYDNISRLRQIFNRMPARLYGYIWNIMTPIMTDFKIAFRDRDTFKEFYRDHSKKKGSSSKVVACFLQQSFGLEALPIDTWVRTFIYYPLGMSPKNDGGDEPPKTMQDDLYEKYSKLDKLEKLIWVSSMGNKTNKTEFLNILWCQRYGTDKGSKGPCRGANPLSCLNCVLKDECLGYAAIKDETMLISNDINELETTIREEGLFFGLLTDNGTPRKVYTLQRGDFVERDSHSGLDLPLTTHIDNGTMTVQEFIDSV